MKFLHLVVIALLCCTFVGCASLARVFVPEIPYHDAPPVAEVVDPEFEGRALEIAGPGAVEVDQRWTVISHDWAVDRRTDTTGHSQIMGRFRLVWIGGPEIDKDRGPEDPKDCYFVLHEGYQEYMGGGSYGPTRINAFPYNHANLHRMKCETEEDIALATPPHWQ